MPPLLALFACTIFVFFLLRVERRQASDVSALIWLPTLWFLFISSKPLGTWFGTETDEGSLLDELFLSGLLLIGVLILMGSRRFHLAPVLRRNVWLLLFLGYSLLSVLWSDIPFVALKRWIRELVAVVMALLILVDSNPRLALGSVLHRAAFVLIPFSLLLIKYFPAYGVQYRQQGGQMWIGVALQKNSLGRLCIIAAFFLIWTLVRRWQGRDAPVDRYQTFADAVVLLLGLFLLMGPGDDQYSATAVSSLFAGLTVFVGLLWMRKRGGGIMRSVLTALVAVIIGLGVLQPFLGGSTVASVSSELGRDATLTGRTEIWEGLVPEVVRNPISGSGFASFWNPDTRNRHQIGEAHNGYLEVLLDRGFLGMLLLSMFLLSSLRRAQRLLSADYDWGTLWTCFLVMAVVHNITESSINSYTSDLTAVLLFLAVACTVQEPEKVAGRVPPRIARELP